jgi:hypothetical protein
MPEAKSGALASALGCRIGAHEPAGRTGPGLAALPGELIEMLAVVVQAGYGSFAASRYRVRVMVWAWMRACGMPMTGWV